MAHSAFVALGDIFDRVARAPCRVEERFGLAQLQDALPVLYHLCDWREAADAVAKSALPASLATLTVNILHELARGGSDLDTPLHEMQAKFPALCTARTRLGCCFGDCALLHERPGSFTVGALVEILGRWAKRGVRVWTAETVAEPPPALAATMSARERAEHRESAQSMFAEYEQRFDDLVRRTPVLAFAKPIWAAIARCAVPELPPYADSLLRGPLHAHMRCALPGCERTTAAETDGLLKRCSGGCGGLARYCSAAHARQHWPQHKLFCSRC